MPTPPRQGRERPARQESHESKQLRALLIKHGSPEAIPEDALAPLGYVRTDEGRIVTQKYLEEIRERRKKEKERQEKVFREKLESIPFGPIRITTIEQEVAYRMVTEDLLNRLLKLCEDITSSLKNDVDGARFIIPKDDPFWKFRATFELWGKRHFRDAEIQFLVGELFEDCASVSVRSICFEIFRQEIFEPFITRSDDEEAKINSENSRKLHAVLEREKGLAGDRMEKKNEFSEYIIEQTWEDAIRLFEYTNIGDAFKEKLHQKQAVSIEECLLLFIHEYIAEELPHLREKTSSCTSFSDLSECLQRLQGSDFPSFPLLQEIKRRLKNADQSARQELAGEKKRLDHQLNEEKALAAGIISAITPWEQGVRFLLKSLKTFQGFLVGKKGEMAESVLTLDPTPDAELDADPGEVSGDCTAGKPLPFDDPSIALFNIKVRDNRNAHIGNIYLLCTESTDGKPCWHLDAVQIPNPQIDWGHTMPLIVDALGSAAEKKGVHYITVNQQSALISNYDYLYRPIEKLLKEKDLGETRIDLPYVGKKKYSSFQGNGEVFVLWNAPTPPPQ